MGLGKKSIRIRGADCGVEAILLGVITNIGGFLFGYDTGQISGIQLFQDFIQRFGQEQPNGEIAFTPIILSLIVSLMSIGTLFGALLGAYSADWLGRRKNLTLGVFIFIIGNILQITAMNSWVHMMIGRMVAGVGVGILSVGVPLFMSETSPKEIRGPVVASYQLMITVGILVSNIVNYGVRDIQESAWSWRAVILIGIIFSLPLGIGVLFCVESPRWLMGQGRAEEAKLAMARLRGVKGDLDNVFVERDFREMREAIEAEKSVGNAGWVECFTGKPSGITRLAYRTYLGCALQFLQQWTGVNYFFYYGATIFQSAGIEDPIQTQLILGAVNVFCTLWGLWILGRFGRRKPLFFGGIWQAVWFCVFSATATAVDPTTNSTIGIVMIVSGCLFIASFAATWGPGIWIIIGEIFPLKSRAKQASLATSFNWLGNFMVAFLTPLADDGIGAAYGFVFVACNLAGALVVYFFVFESENLTLEAVDEMYRTKDLKAWKSSSWIPAGWHDRNNRMDADMADDVTRVGSEDLGRKSYKTNHAQIEKAGTPPQHA